MSSTKDILPAPFEWIAIPAGQVTLPKSFQYEQNDYYVPFFRISKYPITRSQFAKFIEADGYNNPTYWTEFGWKRRSQGNWSKPQYWTNPDYIGDNRPVIGISWYEAIAFCTWLSTMSKEEITLPTVHQWRRASQSDKSKKYTWGNEFDSEKANLVESDINTTTSVTQYEGLNDSPFGVVDMIGNVKEWSLTRFHSMKRSLDSDETRVVCGSSWFNGARSAQLTRHFLNSSPHKRYPYTGMRIVCDVEGHADYQ